MRDDGNGEAQLVSIHPWANLQTAFNEAPDNVETTIKLVLPTDEIPTGAGYTAVVTGDDGSVTALTGDAALTIPANKAIILQCRLVKKARLKKSKL